jgi:formylglycine-generating enzyme required for sulfatase activity
MARLALLIGVSEYGAGIPALPECVVDVDAMQRVLVHPEMGGFAAVDITVLKDPQRQEMVDAIHQLFSNRKPDDLLLFYFSGHGMMDEDEYKLHLANSGTYTNENSRVYAPSAVEAAYIHQRLNYSKSKHLVLILDCCYSGAFAKEMTKGDSIINLDNYLGGKGRAILTSSTASELSLGAKVKTEHGNSGLSIYTRYLVEGIKTGAADLDNDGFIGVEELHEYASKRVKEAAPAMNPMFYPQERGNKIILAKSPKDDSKLKYRKEVEKWVEPPLGKISSVARRLLKLKQIELGISPDDAESIEAEVLQPYTELVHKLGEYEKALIEAVESGYPFSPMVEAALKAYYEEGLKLKYEHIVEIEQRVLKAVKSSLPKIQFTSVKVDVKGEIIDRPQGEAEIFVEDLGDDVSLTMVKIPGSEFLMGSPISEEGHRDSESPQHLVKVPEFYMGQTLVTQAQWQQVMGNNPSHFTGDGKLPVEQVSWLDTQEFCQKLSTQTPHKYRLPSEAEWEYACRARTNTPFYFGETISAEVANYCAQDWEYQGTTYPGKYGNGKLGEFREKTTLVGDFPPNAFGLYDLHGNLWEWCQDHWHENYQGAPIDGSSWLDLDAAENAFRVLRGGSWFSIPRYCRSASRFNYSPDFRNFNFGFRVVCEIPRTL